MVEFESLVDVQVDTRLRKNIMSLCIIQTVSIVCSYYSIYVMTLSRHLVQNEDIYSSSTYDLLNISKSFTRFSQFECASDDM